MPEGDELDGVAVPIENQDFVPAVGPEVCPRLAGEKADAVVGRSLKVDEAVGVLRIKNNRLLLVAGAVVERMPEGKLPDKHRVISVREVVELDGLAHGCGGGEEAPFALCRQQTLIDKAILHIRVLAVVPLRIFPEATHDPPLAIHQSKPMSANDSGGDKQILPHRSNLENSKQTTVFLHFQNSKAEAAG